MKSTHQVNNDRRESAATQCWALIGQARKRGRGLGLTDRPNNITNDGAAVRQFQKLALETGKARLSMIERLNQYCK